MIKLIPVDLEKILEKYKIPIGIGLVGLVLLGTGFFLFSLNKSESPKIEIIPEAATNGQRIFVDIEGAVLSPGVYELLSSARMNDLLIRAGGLSAEADRDWVAQNLNLALKLEDGMKVYVPSQKEVAQFGGPALSTQGSVAGVASKININSASSAQLDTLWGIGEKRAQDIITNRPYQNIEDLVNRKIIPQNVYERIKEQITAY